MMDALAADSAGLAPPDYVELRYEELDHDALSAIEAIYRSLDLPGFDAGRGAFETYIASVKKFEKNRFHYSEDDARKVEARLGRFIEQGRYRRPGAA
jgi:hypothetical protein